MRSSDSESDRVGSLLAQAREQYERGDNDRAKAAYLALVARAPRDFRVLNDVGTFFFATGFHSAARTAYAEAVKWHPEIALGHANLGNALFALGDFAGARIEYATAIEIDPTLVAAHQGLSYALTRLGNASEARVHADLGFAASPLTTAPYRGTGTPVRVLRIVSARGGNVYTDSFLDDRTFLVMTLVAEYADLDAPLPEHDVAFNTIGDADRCASALVRAESIVARSTARILNHPRRVLATDRVSAARSLGAIPGVVTPATVAMPRGVLMAADAGEALARAGFTFPVLVRAPGYHTGEHFSLVANAESLPSAVAALPGDDLLVIAYIDTRGSDGAFRKYRTMIVGGTLLPLHVAISRDWKVHYFRAEMASSAANRAEDERFLVGMNATLGPAIVSRLERIAQALGLDYAGIDFGIHDAGHVVIFEANATMIVLPPPPEDLWAYRRDPVRRVLDAARGIVAGTVLY